MHYTLVWSLRREANLPILALFKWHSVCSNGFGFQDKLVKIKTWLPGLLLYKAANPAYYSRLSQNTTLVS